MLLVLLVLLVLLRGGHHDHVVALTRRDEAPLLQGRLEEELGLGPLVRRAPDAAVRRGHVLVEVRQLHAHAQALASGGELASC